MKRIVFILLLLLVVFYSYANESNTIDNEIYDAFLKNVINDYNIPGLTVSIFTDEGITYSTSYGYLKSGEAIDINASFFLGSTSKTITALAIMLLVDEGKINIKDPVKKYLPQFYFNDDTIAPGAENTITIENLLNHNSGISDTGMPGQSMGEISKAC